MLKHPMLEYVNEEGPSGKRFPHILCPGCGAGQVLNYTLHAVDDLIKETGAGTRNNAYVTVEVLTAGCEVWAYGAVIDGTEAFPGTNDPTTIPLTILE